MRSRLGDLRWSLHGGEYCCDGKLAREHRAHRAQRGLLAGDQRCHRRLLGADYINAIVNYVNLLHEAGMYAEISLMWSAPGTSVANSQIAAPDEDHSPAVWQGMADAFKNDPNVILAPFGEPTVGWSCWINGCAAGASGGRAMRRLERNRRST